MRLNQPLLQLPISFCADTLTAEVRKLPANAWLPHPQGFVGNEAVPLVTPGGAITDAFIGEMAPTEALRQCPYIMEVMREIGAVWGRGRLMGLGAGAEVPPHVDIKYYWRTHIRIHIPVITNPDVRFTCGGQTVHMKAGECWVFDTFQDHTVENAGHAQRVHLVLDTVGGLELWDLIDAAQKRAELRSRVIRPGEGRKGELRFERFQAPRIMSPWELRFHVDQLLDACLPNTDVDHVRSRLDRFINGWFAAWAIYRADDGGLSSYQGLVASARQDLEPLKDSGIMLHNGRSLFNVLEVLLFGNAVAPDPIRNAIDSAAAANVVDQRLTA
jgi:hypothetical protein